MAEGRAATLIAGFRAFRRARKGSVAVAFALGMPVVAAGAAFSVETSYHYYKQTSLQAAADAAAVAGGLERLRGGRGSAIRTAARQTATENGWDSAAGTITVNSPPTAGAYTSQPAVEVILAQTEPRFFSALLTRTPVRLRARAVGLYRIASNACVLALSRDAGPAVNIKGSARLELQGCDVVANSVADDALNVWGAARLTADCAVSAGGVRNKDGMRLAECGAPVTQAPPVEDPLKDLPEPSPTGPCQNDKADVLVPGRYCSGLDLKGDVRLEPGVYHLAGDFRANANASVSGEGVTIYMSDGAEVRINGGAQLTLSAPSSGTYAGVLFFGDRDSTGGDNVFNGNARSRFTGHLYFPSQSVTYNGNFSGENGCTHVIADTVTWSGNATLEVDCTDTGMVEIPGRRVVRLVE
ncbi:TadE/TadG family type IV pilus assembly protein [Phenylobacterium sp.]|jgi:Flp pilus assembly protein TadG|uniref:TadE/TadG family type IV pilus assembly protein n=1 Tax=Phenylobacterium sp. TaxID=1871053 RepID=UPI00378407D1